MIEIRPDPRHPHGGFAELTISGAVAESDPVTVAVFNSYQQKWLSPEGWQANKATIPARSASQEGDVLRLIVGPEIVNQIEEDTPIRVEVGAGSWDTYWPDDINAGPDEAIIGDIGGTGATPESKAPTVMVAAPEADSSETVLSATETAEDEDSGSQEEDSGAEENTGGEGKSRSIGVMAGIAALVLLLGGGAYFFLSGADDAEPDATETAIVEPEQNAPANDPCEQSQLAELSSQGFTTLASKIRECGSSVSADNALGFVEKAANSGDADALALFGALYDATVTDDVIEGQIGLTFPDQPSRAAEYYSRAAAAGSEQATSNLTAICNRLRLKSDTLSQSALEDYCQ